MAKPFIDSSFSASDPAFEVPLRPQSLQEFAGQETICERLDVIVQAAQARGEVLGHCLLSGPPGLGKTTLAHILAKAMGSHLVVTSGPVLEKPGDLAGILTNLKSADVFFIDEIHRIPRAVEEYLYQAMEDFHLDLMLDSGPNARSVQIQLPRFTLVGATTRLGLLSEPFRARFGFTGRLDYYSPEKLQKIIQRTATVLQVKIDLDAALEIAKRARGTPRVANQLLRWVRDYAQIKAEGYINRNIAQKALEMLSIDERGLDEMDKKLLLAMIQHHQGGPVGLNALSALLGEEPDTIEEVYEPFLVIQGLLRRTPRGREVTPLGYQHLRLEEKMV